MDRGWKSQANRPDTTNLLFIVVDTLRADHLSCYGYDRIKTPTIDSLADQGIRFDKTYSAAPWTCPSMASIFTSLYPEAHGMVLHPIRDAKKFRVLSSKLTTLTEILKEHGAETHAISEQIWCSETFGFNQGFDSFLMLEEGSRELTDRALTRIETLTPDRPFFLYLHYLDPHTPYTPPEAFRIPHPDRGRFGLEELDWDGWWQKLWQVNGQTPDVDAFLEYVRSLYDGEIRFVDHEIGRVLKSIEAQGLSDNTVVVLIADHGEAFLEHAMLHGSTLFNEELLVPMIIKVPWEPELKGQVFTSPVSTLDLVPTVLDFMNLSIPKTIQGKSHVPALWTSITGKDTKPAVPIQKFQRAESAYDPDLKKVVSQGFSLILNSRTRQCNFFDLTNDPLEQKDVLDLFPAEFDEHWKYMTRWLEEEKHWVKPDGPTINLSSEVEDRLRGLGYLK
ncbi:MAG: sulfatase [Planctomycetes bacterium]|nr:sulfatase [Planctomycetota bacterium]